MSRLILYMGEGSPPSRSVMMLSELIGVQLETKKVKLLHVEHRQPPFRKLNPMSTVPVLQDGDFVLSESHAILKYLIGKYGGDKREELYPSEVRKRAVVDQCMFFNAGVFFPGVMGITKQAMLGTSVGPTEEDFQNIKSSYAVLEAYLRERTYVAADHLTLADLSTGSTATAVQTILKVDPDKYPRCSDWLSRLQDTHIFKTINEPGVAFLSKMVEKLWEKNKLQKHL